MLPRELHDPAVLETIMKEADFMAQHVIGEWQRKCYRQMHIAARVLKDAILGLNRKYPCPACQRMIGLCQDGTFRFHFGKLTKANCKMSGKLYESLEPVPANAAPALLAACKLAVKEFGPESDSDNPWFVYDQINQVITKAESMGIKPESQ